MENVYIEQDCTFEAKGRKFTAGGAVVTPHEIIAYPGKNGILSDWRGNKLGTYRIVATWKTPASFYSGTMHQIEATVNGATYTGRGAGEGMIYRGKRKRS